MKDNAWAALLPGLGLLVGFVYYWSNNVTYFSGTAFLVSLLLLLGVCLGLFLLCRFVLPWLLKKFIKNTYERPFFAIAIAGLSSFCAFCIINFHIFYQRRGWAIALFILVFLLLMRGKQRILAIFLSLLLFISSGIFIYKFIILHYQQEKIFADIRHKNDTIHFVKKPNIYIYWLESYQDLNMLRSVFNIDVDGFEKFLLANDFHIQADIYSSGRHTLESMSQLYAQERLNSPVFTSSDALWEIRNLIGGGPYNYVYRILKDNGYRTYMIFHFDQGYYMHEKGMYLDEVAFAPTLVSRYLSPIITFTYPWVQDFLGYVSGSRQLGLNLTNDYPDDFIKKVKHAITRAQAEGKPYILSFKGGAEHTGASHSWKQRNEWIHSQFYQERVRRSNHEIEEILTYIIQNDPDSIIILLGDHGPYTYRGFPLNAENFSKEGVSKQDIMNDVFNVFFAWRMPGGRNEDLSHGMYMNNINVLMHIFSWLATDPDLLDKRSQSTSIYGPLKAVEGVIQ